MHPNPDQTEGFLISQDEVEDASVWFDHGLLKAHVTVARDSKWSPETLTKACVETIGPSNTPCEFVVISRLPRAA